MQVFLLLILVSLSDQNYEVRMAPMKDMATCQVEKANITVVPLAGISYFVDCITPHDTAEMPA